MMILKYVWYFYFRVFYEYQINVVLEINDGHNNYYAFVHNLNSINIIQKYPRFIGDEEI